LLKSVAITYKTGRVIYHGSNTYYGQSSKT
jgi:hypothetical protein